MLHSKLLLAGAVSAVVLSLPARDAAAQVNIGVTVSATGPAAALGIPERNTVSLLPAEIAGLKVTWTVLDDATDPSQATKNARRFVEELKADAIVGSSATPPAVAVAAVADETKTPAITLSPADLPPEKNRWVFRAPQHNSLMAKALVEHMRASGVKRLGFIGYSDAYGESWLKELQILAKLAGIALEPIERYARTDTSVTGQVLKLVAANPDAILVAGSGTPAALPQTALADRGYKGRVYQTHGAVSRDFLRVAGKSAEGAVFPIGPVVVADQLPDTHPSKKIAKTYVAAYEKQYGAGTVSSFGGHMYDAYLLLANAIPAARKVAQPGTPEFRAALRDALEKSRDVVGVHGVFNMSLGDHFGHDERARVLITVQNGDWKMLPATAAAK